MKGVSHLSSNTSPCSGGVPMEQRHQLEALTANFPGGIHQCTCTDGFVLIFASADFLRLVDYTREEMASRFGNRLIEMIHPEDRPRVLSDVEEQLARGDYAALEYRIVHRDGSYRWVLAQGNRAPGPNGTPIFYGILTDISRQREEQDQMRLMWERHEVILNQTTDIIFEWDLCKDELYYSPNWRRKFGYSAISTEIQNRMVHSANIHPEDLPVFVKLMEEVASGKEYNEAEVRLREASGRYVWCRIRATTQYDGENRPVKAVGVILDISAQKREWQELLDLAQRDSLTGLYNKAAMRALTQQQMAGRQETGCQALLIIDVDDFKTVNDTYGHMVGDMVLTDVAAVLKRSFRTADLVGRVGGDEFSVYLPHISDEVAVRQRILAAREALSKIHPNKDAPPISCSIGVALFPCGTEDYSTLYQCADKALYQVKHTGKGNVFYYDPAVCGDTLPGTLARMVTNTTIDSDRENPVDTQLATYAFRMLYKAQDIETSVRQILELVGNAYDVSRVYIFESSEDGKRCSNTFEWCGEGVPPEIQNLTNLDYQTDLGGYLDNFNGDGVFYCRDITQLNPTLYKVLSPQGIRSLLQCAIRDDGEFYGFVGFDECRENRSWTKEQISSLTLTANVLSTFIIKRRLKEKLQRFKGK